MGENKAHEEREREREKKKRKMATEKEEDIRHHHHHRRKVGYRRSSKFVLDDLFNDSDSDENLPLSEEQIAASSAGLDFERVSFLEKKDFEHQLRDGNSEAHYLGVRNKIVTMWRRDVKRRLEVKEVIDLVKNYEERMIRDVFDWLERNGGINYGVLVEKEEKEEETTVAAATADGAANAEDASAAAAVAAVVVDDATITKELILLLKTCDMNVMTEKMIRKKLGSEECLNMDLSEKKGLIKEVVTKYLTEGAEAFDGLFEEDKNKEEKTNKSDEDDGEDEISFKWRLPPAVDEGKVHPNIRERDVDTSKPVIIIGAGPSGLACANQLKSRNVPVVVLEARDRVGGRVWTERETFSAPVDFGASIVTGTEPNPKARTGMPWLGIRADPSAEVSSQIDLKLVELRPGCPLYDGKDGSLVDGEKDARIEKLRDLLMDEAREAVEARGEDATADLGLGEMIEDLTKVHFEREFLEDKLKKKQQQQQEEKQGEDDDKDNDKEDDEDDDDMNEEKKRQRMEKIKQFSKDDKRLLDWHWANLEYGCSAKLGDVSLPHWNQDEMYGGFGGPHCMVRNGYGQITDALAREIEKNGEIKLNSIVKKVTVTSTKNPFDGVNVECADGTTYEGSAVVCTVPLGCLKNNDVEFVPELSAAKQNAVQRLGFGNLNKLVIEFEEQFWSDDRDYFGVAVDSDDESKMNNRARCFMFWNLKPVCGENMLIALVAGSNAEDTENNVTEESQQELVNLAVEQLAKVHFNGDQSKIRVKTAKATAWGKDPFARGSYSYVKKSSRGAADYDELGRPELKGRLFFAGEHTCKEHPDTVGGAMLTGWRAARQVLRKLSGEEGKIFDEVFDLEEMRKKAEEEARQLALMEDSDYDSELEGEDFEKMKAAIERKREAEERARNQVVDADALAGRDEAKSVYKISMTVDSSSKTNSIGLALAELMVENENHYALKTGAGKRALMHAVLSLTNAEKEKWAYGKHNGLATFNEWLGKFAKRARRNDDEEDAMTALKVIRSIPFDFKLMKKSGVPLTIKDYYQSHENAGLKQMSKMITREWMRLLALGGDKTRLSVGGPISPYGNVLAPKQDNNITTTLLNSIKNNGMNTIASEVAKNANNKDNALSDKELLVLHEKQRKEAKEAAERKLRDHREAVVKAASDLPEGQAALAARQAAEQAKLDAERAIQAAKEAAQTAMEHHNDTDSDEDQGMNMNISSFEDFQNAANLKREKKRAKAKAKAAKRAREDAEDAAALGEEDDALAAANAKKSKASADAGTLTEEAYEERVTKQVTKYVFEQLKLKRDRDILTKKQCKKYEEKIVRTVIDHAKGDSSGGTKLDPSVAFMTSQRKEKIKSLVNKYAVVGQKENETKKNNKKD